MLNYSTAIIAWLITGTICAVITFIIFGAELPTYLTLGIIGLTMYNSQNPFLRFTGVFLSRIFIILFFVTFFYYFGVRTFFPENPFEFKFLMVGLDYFNETSNRIGEFVLRLFK